MKRIVVIGGGSGTSAVLRALKPFPCELTAILSMADDGSSTGVLRQAYGTLPVGDMRQCLLNLSNQDQATRDMFAYRFAEGPLKGHTVGNIVLTAAILKSHPEQAIRLFSKFMQVEGHVIPATLDHNYSLNVRHAGGTLHGEHEVDEGVFVEPWEAFLQPVPAANPTAIEAIMEADVIIIGPGTFVASLVATLLVSGIREALRETKAKLIFNVNPITTPGQTDGWTTVRFVHEMEKILGRKIDIATYNTPPLSPDTLASCPAGTEAVRLGVPSGQEQTRLVGAELLSAVVVDKVAGDTIARSPVAYDTQHFGDLLWKLIND